MPRPDCGIRVRMTRPCSPGPLDSSRYAHASLTGNRAHLVTAMLRMRKVRLITHLLFPSLYHETVRDFTRPRGELPAPCQAGDRQAGVQAIRTHGAGLASTCQRAGMARRRNLSGRRRWRIGGFIMEARHVLIALLVAFGVAASAAAWTTATHVNTTASSTGHPSGHATLDRTKV